MLIHAAVCPHPPLLVPELAGAAAPELDGLRAACGRAVRGALAAVQAGRNGIVIVVGGGPDTRAHGPEAAGTLRPYGLDRTFGTGDPEGPDALPLSLTIGRWLLEEAAAPGAAARFQSVGEDAAPAECLRLGRELAGSAERVAFLVMGDGSACLSEKAPGYLDPRAEPYDEAVARALGDADTAALAGLDPGVSRELLAAGRPAWQVLAGAAGEAGAAPFDAELLDHRAPYGVGYFVATWTRRA
ncbi:class III extradiol dioxygenase subunit B-like domain-containing protein [Actinomadura viridis]|uniref:Catalytic LigB subunit of aromatic ring-opening dioxygenase n=1 Tax=Actinomadura viridis TaxID=58110 RepID=A0A931GIG2_9ACTN|nr:class III extradiol dioxygenase subunit B-like domain-containing protein [Actinomadura viridis]MBG6087992.1 hypothetical protein [Actinomadura viridis]